MSYEISGENVTLATLRTLEQTLSNAPLLEDVARAALPTLKVYPPELPNQRYVRTGNLGAGWQYGAASGGPSGRVIDLFNPVEYAGDVYGAQKPAFVGRWKTVAQLRAAIAPQVRAGFEAWVKQVLQ